VDDYNVEEEEDMMNSYINNEDIMLIV